MDDNWQIESLEIRGGFLDGVNLRLPPGLTCVIGPRGSGKSTLAEAFRWVIAGVEGASKARLDLLKANLQKATVTAKTRPSVNHVGYVIRREFRQVPLLTTSDGRALKDVDLDRGTFLPLDAYSSHEIEEIADQSLGPRRRALLDDLHPTELSELEDQLAAAKRDLMANADAIRAQTRIVADTAEQLQALGDVKAKLAALPGPAATDPIAQPLQTAARQQQINQREVTTVAAVTETITALERAASDFGSTAARKLSPVAADSDSANRSIVGRVGELSRQLATTLKAGMASLTEALQEARAGLEGVKAELATAHAQQSAVFAAFQEKNHAASHAARERADAEQAVARTAQLEAQRQTAIDTRENLQRERPGLRARYVQLRDGVSELREKTAAAILAHAGEHVRIRVRRHADTLAYQQALAGALPGAGVKGHDAIVDSVLRCRPDELAQIIASRNVDELESICHLGLDRSRRVLDAFAQTLDPLDLEVFSLDDLVAIELNVGPEGKPPLYKDAAELSRGQKCTALLPLLLARRRAPLLVDQPEDNLDNHFIFRTVVESVRRLRAVRQMLFITHNANIPVLGEADLVVVMGSDGQSGHIEKQGTVDECQQEIIDLLEGGRDAFELRRQRYARR
jgi:ABC-type lipoprotein export system ATPase subunit